MIRTNAFRVGDGLSAYEQAVARTLQRVAENATFKLQAEAKKEAPVDTGFLRKNIDAELGVLRGRVVARASYSGFVHDGTRHQSANPFLLRAKVTTVAWLRGQGIKVE
jgi:HK97 gp10 family phage protein